MRGELTLSFLHGQSKAQAEQAGCKINANSLSGAAAQIEEYMKLQNMMFQVKYNQRQYLNGRWNMLERRLNDALPMLVPESKIIMSVSAVQGEKTTSTGFHPIGYDNFKEVAEAMHLFAHSPSVYSPILRWDKYTGVMKWDYRRRLHNISFIGNVLAYDFDDGTLTFERAVEIARSTKHEALVIRSKSDPKYKHDRFKVLFKTDVMYPSYSKDEAIEGFTKAPMPRYKEVYKKFAIRHGLFEHMDASTLDASRLIARVTNTDNERREYELIGRS